jgi:hypothetical protein
MCVGDESSSSREIACGPLGCIFDPDEYPTTVVILLLLSNMPWPVRTETAKNGTVDG